MRLYIKVLAACLFALLGVLWGAWWAPFFVGAAFGLIIKCRIKNRLSGAIQVTAGATHGLHAAVRALLDPGDELLLCAPYWPLIRGIATNAGAVPVVLTILVGALLGLTGAWLGSAVASVVAPRASVDGTAR